MSESPSSQREMAMKARVPAIGRLEMHVTHTCNLKCASCCHYSNHGHRGNVSISEAEAWMLAWRGRFTVNEFVLLGGEPTLHPQLPRFIPLVRKHWPEAKLTLVTNGFFLHRHPDLPRVVAGCSDAQIALSVHHGSPAYLARLQPVFELIEKWRNDYGITVVVTQSHRDWTLRYRGFGTSMLPFEDNDARRSWESCPARHCLQLFEGKLWKCAPIAYLELQRQKFDLSEKWEPYLDYRPLSSAAGDRALLEFIGREDEGVCAMCPAKPRKFELPNPMASAVEG